MKKYLWLVMLSGDVLADDAVDTDQMLLGGVLGGLGFLGHTKINTFNVDQALIKETLDRADVVKALLEKKEQLMAGEQLAKKANKGFEKYLKQQGQTLPDTPEGIQQKLTSLLLDNTEDHVLKAQLGLREEQQAVMQKLYTEIDLLKKTVIDQDVMKKLKKAGIQHLNKDATWADVLNALQTKITTSNLDQGILAKIKNVAKNHFRRAKSKDVGATMTKHVDELKDLLQKIIV